jgi:DNA polymerase-3 subunit gamma/tau
MLGLADRGRVLDLFGMILRGDAAGALTELGGQYAAGADPLAVLRDLAEVCHWLSVVKITPAAAEDPTVAPDERVRGLEMSAGVPISVLSRFWQMLLKALEEVAQAPNAMMAAEMAVIRLTHVAEMPTPDDLVRRLQEAPAGGAAPAPRAAPVAAPSGPQASLQAVARAPAGGAMPAVALEAGALARFARFEDVVDLIRAQRDMTLLMAVETQLRLVRYQPGRIEVSPTPQAAPDLVQRLGSRLQGWTGNRWVVIVSDDPAGPTLAEARRSAEDAARTEAEAHPLVAQVLAAFPKARIAAIRPPKAAVPEAEPTTGEPEVPDDWDPFEDE